MHVHIFWVEAGGGGGGLICKNSRTDYSNPCPCMYCIEQKHAFEHSFDQNDILQYRIWGEKALERIYGQKHTF